ncbi:hypothetical protein BJX61DRAFT_518962 [Aspergillus egyptiacus]|nr:hypothetical protein BJX61DRAFT_518962 [Aspergillus egyptiacus]
MVVRGWLGRSSLPMPLVEYTLRLYRRQLAFRDDCPKQEVSRPPQDMETSPLGKTGQ